MIGTIVGGLISFGATVWSEAVRDRRNQQKEKLGTVLIPYCAEVEETLEKSNADYTDSTILFETLRKPLLYLRAEKRAYLA